MLRLSIWIGLLTLYGAVLAQDTGPLNEFHHYVSQETAQSSRTKRFGFSIIEEIRQNFCNSFCKSSNSTPFMLNFICAIKCPELQPQDTTDKIETKPTSQTPIKTKPPPESLTTNQAPTNQPTMPMIMG